MESVFVGEDGVARVTVRLRHGLLAKVDEYAARHTEGNRSMAVRSMLRGYVEAET